MLMAAGGGCGGETSDVPMTNLPSWDDGTITIAVAIAVKLSDGAVEILVCTADA